MRLYIQTIGWLLCVVYSTIPSYWLIIHPFANQWRTRTRSPFRVLLPVWIGMWVVAALLTSRWRHVVWYDTSLSWIPAFVLFGAGLWLYRHSGQEFTSKQLGGLPELLPNRGDQKLVTTGIRSRVRHPVYLAHLCEMVAWCLGTGSAACYSLAAFAVLTGTVMVKMEDAELERRFGREFLDYRSQVPAMLPRLTAK